MKPLINKTFIFFPTLNVCARAHDSAFGILA